MTHPSPTHPSPTQSSAMQDTAVQDEAARSGAAHGMAQLSRSALVEAILPIVAEEPSISLSQLAKRLGVGRTTLYRHFTDRETLLRAVARAGAHQYLAAALRAAPDRGAGAEAIERLCTELFEVPDVLTLLFADDPLLTDAELEAAAAELGAQQPTADGDPFEIAIARGQADGSLDARVPAGWAATFVLMTIASGHLYAVTAGTSRADALALVLRALRRTLGTAAEV